MAAEKSKSMSARTNFSDLGLFTWMTTQCKILGLSKPTKIQIDCVPAILEGKDCIGIAKTGSGKTAAFALPILQKLSEDPYGIFCLCLTPTRELAFQIADQFRALGKPVNVRVTVITGGQDIMRQGQELTDQPHIVISTPGRLADHIQSCDTFKFNKIKYLVMDEADRLFEDNFGEQLAVIFTKIPKQRQTLLFSATMTETLKELLSLKNPFISEPISDVATVEELEQKYLLVPADVKDAHLVHVLHCFMKSRPNSLIMIFTNTCKYTQILGMILEEVGLPNVTLHSVLKQRQRMAALTKFKSHQVKIIIATDVASRGLDIPTVDYVINHNVPSRAKDYIHRVGRTARAGRSGTALTLVTQFDLKLVKAVEERINYKLKERKPDDVAVTKIVVEVAVARREAEIKLDEQDFGAAKEINKRKKIIMEGRDPDQVEQEKKKKRRANQRKLRKEAKAS